MNQKNQNNSQGNNQPKITNKVKNLPLNQFSPSNLGKGGERRLDTAQFSESRKKNESDNSDKE